MTDNNSRGHNSESYRVTASELREFIKRIEDAEAERKEQNEVIKETKQYAKSKGYDVKALTEIIRRRKRERSAVTELDALVNLYEEALGIFG